MVYNNKKTVFFLTFFWFVLGLILLLKGLCILAEVILSQTSFNFPLVNKLLLFMEAKEVVGVFFIGISFFIGFAAANLLKIIRIDYKKIKNQKRPKKIKSLNIGLFFSILILFIFFQFIMKAFSFPDDIIGIIYTTLGCFFMIGSFRFSYSVIKFRYL